MRSVVFASVLCLTLFSFCTNTTPPTANALVPSSTVSMPANAGPANVSISSLNCWVEKGQFFVTGICDNASDEWQKIWLRMAPLDHSGNPLTIDGTPGAVFSVFSDATPPRGRTSFFAEWPVTAFSGTPDSCIITGAGTILTAPGPILIAMEDSGVKMIVSDTVDGKLVSVEKAWQVNVVVENPLDRQADHPRVELLIYDSDDRLWFVTVLNPEDPNQKQLLNMEKEGPMLPHEKRRFGAVIYYDNLPQALKDKKIGRVAFQPYNADH